ncbi:MAG: FtsQ-type POTRA domain-containing protein [Bdellovibrionaceae bacterium]|nr:FtsQ-type POTRA domain-containing protein [Pseudobdellovibrionaceae bacterium]
MKPFWKSLTKWLFALIVLPGAVLGFLYHLDGHGFFDLDQIEIVLEDTPAQALHLKPLVAELDRSLELYRGASLWKLDMNLISKAIGGLNWVEVHSLSRNWPSGLVVKIKPQDVKALYLAKNNRFIPVIREGRLLDPVEPKLAPDVAILDGDAFQARADLRKRAIEVLNEIPDDGAFSRKTISEVRWHPKDGFLMKMVRTGLEVKIGDDQIALKANRVGQVLEYLQNRGMNAKSLDANLSKKVLVKLEDGTQSAILR